MDNKNWKVILTDKVINYYKSGYGPREITAMMNEDIKTYYNGEEDKFFEFVKRSIENERLTMSEEEIKKIADVRKEMLEKAKKQKIREIADQVKERIESPLYSGMPREKMAKAANMVAKLVGLKSDKVREYFKQVYPELYQAYMENMRTGEFYEKMAERFIKEDVAKSSAEKAYGYSTMIRYLSENNPELHAKLLESFASHEANPTRNTPVISGSTDIYNNKNLLIEIMLEYRVPFKGASEFVSKYSDIFLVYPKRFISPEEYMETISEKRMDFEKALNWYVTEMSMYYDPEKYDELMLYRIKRFKDFERKFALISNDINNVIKFVKAETAISLASVHKKVAEHIPDTPYNFDNNDIRNILKYSYKYGAGEIDLQKFFGIPRISKSKLPERFKVESIDDQIILEGYKKLLEFKTDMSYAYKVGRK